ncbi:hypothetical protein SAMD00019534_060890 [Acytostelium subglobosum LB1]|uniref:hypothetical protein n=1 Tax=Acytostelium subglobosum LB1 TaxID=1410327 RepID=UPI000644DC47|nr:hypothetical protein SAMD00019534_060890 [Acytostelium subglobosum LB1]GAM22914.1 hypothetical protein SAMD00019534_060890 [Acytostelium subglobosum LB1]|eukprot:XP_012754141.1 hypothetical protein SAMD00019534_060890 [Acytostelium subglobosum LB1]
MIGLKRTTSYIVDGVLARSISSASSMMLLNIRNNNNIVAVNATRQYSNNNNNNSNDMYTSANGEPDTKSSSTPDYESIFTRLFGKIRTDPKDNSNTFIQQKQTMQQQQQQQNDDDLDLMDQFEEPIFTAEKEDKRQRTPNSIEEQLKSLANSAPRRSAAEILRDVKLNLDDYKVDASGRTGRSRSGGYTNDSNAYMQPAPLEDYYGFIKKYNDMLDECNEKHSKPLYQQVCLCIERVPRQLDPAQLENAIHKDFPYKIDAMFWDFVQDNAPGGDFTSILCAIRYNTLTDFDDVIQHSTVSPSPLDADSMDEKTKLLLNDSKPEAIVEKFGLYGLFTQGIRYKVIGAMTVLKLKGIPNSVDEEGLRQELDQHLTLRGGFKLHLQKAKKTANLAVSEHNGTCYMSFDSHIDALECYRRLHQVQLFDKPSRMSWSRKLFTDNSDQAHLMAKLSHAKAKQYGDLQLMKKVIDLTSQLKELQEEREKYKSSKSRR